MENNKIPLRYIIAEIFLVICSFFLMNIFKNETLLLTENYTKLLILYFITWLGTSSFNSKFDKSSFVSLNRLFSTLIRSSLFHLYILTFVLVILDLFEFSRLHILGSCFILFLFELALYLYYYNMMPYSPDYKMENSTSTRIEVTNLLFLGDLIIFLLSIGIGCLLASQHCKFTLLDYKNSLILTGLWFIFGMSTLKFNKNRKVDRNIWYLIDPVLKSTLFILLSISLLIFFVRFDVPLEFVFISLSIYLVLDVTFYVILDKLDFFNIPEKNNKDTVNANGQDLLEITDKNLKEQLLDTVEKVDVGEVKNYKNKFLRLLNSIPRLADLRLGDIDSTDISDIDDLPDTGVDVIFHTGRFNDIHYINRFLLKLHEKIKSGGYFLGRVDTIAADKRKFKERYPHLLRSIIYPFHFLIFRVIPKLPGLKKLYYILSRGKRQIISRAEALGRLSYNGFKVLRLEETDAGFIFICQKLKTPSRDPNPSFGPLIKLDRIGLNGEIVKIYKFRTMYPYSEYIQEYIYESCGIKDSGKFDRDFRLTEWGRWFRRLWIDELPQFINWIKGDLSLVGVRALSKHYFNLYPEELQELRIQFKPGIVPPYYAHLPKNFDEIVASEFKYLRKKQQKPFSTDFLYFFKIFNNIIFHKARSQ